MANTILTGTQAFEPLPEPEQKRIPIPIIEESTKPDPVLPTDPPTFNWSETQDPTSFDVKKSPESGMSMTHALSEPEREHFASIDYLGASALKILNDAYPLGAPWVGDKAAERERNESTAAVERDRKLDEAFVSGNIWTAEERAAHEADMKSRGCPYCKSPRGKACKPGCPTGGGIFVAHDTLSGGYKKLGTKYSGEAESKNEEARKREQNLRDIETISSPAGKSSEEFNAAAKRLREGGSNVGSILQSAEMVRREKEAQRKFEASAYLLRKNMEPIIAREEKRKALMEEVGAQSAAADYEARVAAKHARWMDEVLGFKPMDGPKRFNEVYAEVRAALDKREAEIWGKRLSFIESGIQRARAVPDNYGRKWQLCLVKMEIDAALKWLDNEEQKK